MNSLSEKSGRVVANLASLLFGPKKGSAHKMMVVRQLQLCATSDYLVRNGCWILRKCAMERHRQQCKPETRFDDEHYRPSKICERTCQRTWTDPIVDLSKEPPYELGTQPEEPQPQYHRFNLPVRETRRLPVPELKLRYDDLYYMPDYERSQRVSKQNTTENPASSSTRIFSESTQALPKRLQQAKRRAEEQLREAQRRTECFQCSRKGCRI